MKINRKIVVLIILTGFILMGFVASKTGAGNFQNLKVLPKDISKQNLDKLMDEFKDGLGVNCNFCHVHKKDNPKEWDFPSDEKPEKTVARKMIKMSNRINKKFFHGKAKYGDEKALMEVRCVTCHHNQPHPEAQHKEEIKQ